VDLRDYLDILRARWVLIVVTTLLGASAAAVGSMLTTPLYQSCTTRFVSIHDAQLSVATAYTGSLFTQQRVKSYVDGVTSTPVMQSVVEELGIPLTPGQLASKIDVNNPLDTVNLEICATDPNPVQAQRIASATADQFRAFAGTLEQPQEDGSSLVEISQLEAANLPTAPVSPRTEINIALGFLVGLALGVGAAVLLETLDTRIKSIEVLAKHFDQPLLGVIGYDPEAPKKPLIVQDSPQSKRAESFRQVRTNLQFVDIDHRPRSIVVTSSIPREGKSTTAINLAITIAQTGQPVFLIEGDLRRPKVADYLGIEGGAGLTDVLVGRATVDEVMQPWGASGNLWVLTAGPLPPNPSELLGSQAMADLVHHLEKRATLIIDTPPLLPVTDAAVLSQLAGGAIIVIRTGRTRREQLRTAVSSVEGVGGKILGLVMNMAPAKGPDSHRYGYGYSYDYQSVQTRGKLGDHPPVIPAGLGGRPGVNGSPSPTSTVGPMPPKGAGKPDDVLVAPAVRKSKKEPAATGKVSKDKASSSASALVDRALGRDPKSPEQSQVVLAPVTDALATTTSTDDPPSARSVPPGPRGGRTAPRSQPEAGEPPLSQTVPTADKVIGHSLKVPLPEPVIEEQSVPFEPDAEPVGDWTPPKPRPAFDPLTAPLDEVSRPD